jgi:hypothetical protein
MYLTSVKRDHASKLKTGAFVKAGEIL